MKIYSHRLLRIRVELTRIRIWPIFDLIILFFNIKVTEKKTDSDQTFEEKLDPHLTLEKHKDPA